MGNYFYWLLSYQYSLCIVGKIFINLNAIYQNTFGENYFCEAVIFVYLGINGLSLALDRNFDNVYIDLH